ncbi:5,10-methylenetetrahydrofolate reductase [Candidatus Bathyarchaeota archaeon]|nr:MAG: 5,10-methylenetetrahydrofolate reductase [Candidatus Bathyarchaeota archaeon]
MATQTVSNLMADLKDGKFVFTGELEPEKTTTLEHALEAARKLKGYVVACNVTDNPQSFAYISSLAASYLIQQKVEMEVIYQITCRDRNRIALFSDLLGAGALGIKNVLALTGDHPTLGDTPQAKPVFDLDSVQLLYLIRKMVDEGKDLNDNPIESPPQFFVGAGANPNADPIEPELIKCAKKVQAGAQFFQTQVVFDLDIAKNFLKETSRYNVPVLIGIFPLRSYGVAEYFDKNVPGVKVPEELLEALKKAKKTPDKKERKQKYNEINLNYFANFIKELKKTTSAAGCHVMSVGYESIIPSLAEMVK